MKPLTFAALMAASLALSGCATAAWLSGAIDNPFVSECEWRDCEESE